MLRTTEEFVRYLEREGVKYEYGGTTERGSDLMDVSFKLKNIPSGTVRFIFDKSCESVSLRFYNICNVPESKMTEVLKACLALNRRFRFAKFVLDTSDNTVQAEIDNPLRNNKVSEICNELMIRLFSIVDDGYPELMRAIW